MKTNVYIDGFNLYYGAVKSTKYRWLDLRKLAETLFPLDEIQRIHYFTARVRPRPNDPGQPQRQQIYLRALRTLHKLEIHYGDFRERRTWLPLADPQLGGPRFVEVIKYEEKGTDVNLATQLLVDGFADNYEQAVVVSNDSDLATPIKYVNETLQRKATVVNPYGAAAHRDLVNAATYTKHVWRSHLRKSQLPATIKDRHGTITKPPSW